MRQIHIVLSLVAGLILASRHHAFAQHGDCTSLPDTATLETLIGASFTGDVMFITPPTIVILQMNYVCLVPGTDTGTYRMFSVVVNYTCRGPLCPSATPVSQFDFSCNSGRKWEDGLNQHFHREVADADLTTPNNTECLFCVAPDHPLLVTIDLPYNDTTHCVACPPSCAESDTRCSSACLLSSSQNALAEFGSCTSLPDERTLQSLITTSITAGFTFIVPPMITITNINYVCLVSETFSGTYRILSVVVEYECSGLFLCPSVMPLSQYDFSCNSSGMWEDGLNQHFHRDVADADLTTPNRTECSFCVAPNHPLLAAIALPYDNVTHCVEFIRFKSSEYVFAEEDGSGSVEIEGPPGLSVTVVGGPGTTMDGIGISGTAVNTTVTLPATVTFNITDDDVSLEVNETYSLTVTTSDSSEIFEERTTTIIITDDVDDVSIRFDQSLYTVDESGSVEITLILDGGIATSISVTIQPVPQVQPNGVTPSTPTTNYTVEFNESEVPQSLSFILSPIDDNILREPDETFQLVFGSVSDARVIQGPESTVVILDDDEIEFVRFNSSEYVFAEEDGTGSVEIEGTLGLSVTVVGGPDTTMDGVHISGTDVNTTVTLPATITFNITDDDISLEANETYSLTVTTSDSSVVIEEPTTTIIITDDVDDVSVRFDPSFYTVDESGSIEITLALDKGIATSISVTIQPVEEPQSTQFTTGFTPSIPTTNYTVEFPESDIPQSQSFILSPVDDSVIRETIEVILLEFAHISDARVTLGQPATVVIINDDVEIGFRIDALTISESEESVEVCLNTLGTPLMDTTINVSVLYGSAREEDFNLTTDEVVIAAEATEPCVVFTALADSLALEGQEMLTLSLSGPENVIISNATVNIIINDANVVTIGFMDMSAEGTEDSGVINVTVIQSIATATPINLTITPTELSPGDIPSDLPFEDSPNIAIDRLQGVPVCNSVDEGQCTSYCIGNWGNCPGKNSIEHTGDDYSTEVVSFTVPPGVGPTIVQLDILDDVIKENTEQYFAGVLEFSGDSTGAALGISNIQLVIIDDENITIGFVESSHVLEEGDSDIRFNISVFKSLETEQSYMITLVGMPLSAEEDDYSLSDMSIFFPENETLDVFVTITGDTRIEQAENFTIRVEQSGGPPFGVDPNTVSTLISIVDNDGEYVYLPVESPYFVPEGTTRTVSFMLTNPPASEDGFGFEFTVVLATEDGEAIAGSDYIMIAEAVFAGADTISINVTVLDDGLVELPESFFLTGLVVEEDVPVAFGDRLEVFIISDEAEIRFEETLYPTSESEGSVDVCVAVSNGILDFNLSVNIEVLPISNAVEEEDYSFDSVPPVINILSGTSRGCLTINIITSALAESFEGIYLVINETTTMADVLEERTIVVIDADGVVTLGFLNDTYAFMEGDAVEVVVQYLGQIDQNITYQVFSDGFINTTSTIEAGSMSTNITFVIPGFDDNVIALEPDEVFDVELSLVDPDPQVEITIPVTTVTITDNDVVTIGFMDMSAEGTEDSGIINVTVIQSIATATPINLTITPTELSPGDIPSDLPFEDSPNIAIAGDDYSTEVVSFTVPPGVGPTIVQLDILDDVIKENTEQYFAGVLEFSAESTGAALGISNIQLVIIDDENITIGFVESSHVLEEGDGDIRFNISVFKSLETEQSYIITLVGMPLSAEEDDYSLPDMSIFFPENETLDVFVTITGDTRIEQTENFTMRVEQLGGPPFGVDPNTVSTLISIVDNDGEYVYIPGERPYFVPEGTTATVRFELTNPPAPEDGFEFEFTVFLSTQDGDALAGSDYVQISEAAFSGNNSINGTITTDVTVLDDGLIEPPESFIIIGRLREDDIPVVFNGSLTVVIISDDVAVGLTQPEYTGSEDIGSVDICVNIVAGTVIDSVEITVITSDITAIDDEDYIGGSYLVTLSSNMTTSCVTIDIVQDSIIEIREEFRVEIFSEEDSVVIANASSSSIVFIDGEIVVITFEESVYTTTETSIIVAACVAATSGILSFNLPVNIELQPSTAVEGEDFTFISVPPVIVITSGTSRGCLIINIIPSDLVEGEEDIHLTINEEATQAVVLNGSTTVVIESDGVVMLRFDRAEYQFMEGEPIELVIQNIGQFYSNITFLVYGEGLINATATIEAGTPDTNITISALGFDDDSIALEPDEVYTVTLSLVQPNPQIVIPTPLANVIIVDNDGPVMIGFDEQNMTIPENIDGVLVAVSLAQEIAIPVTVNFTVVNGTAMEGEDYVRTGLSTLTFNESGTQNILVNIVNDSVIEDSESFTIILSNPQPDNVVLDPDIIIIIIVDNDEPVIRFEETDYVTSEMDGSVDVCVTVLNGILVNSLTVNIDLLPSTAIEGEDFEFNSQPPVINILSGMSRGCLTITILPSDLVEGDENIHLAINEETTMAIVEEGNTTVMIASDGVVILRFDRAEYQVIEREAIQLVVTKSAPLDSELTFIVSHDELSVEGTFEAGVNAANVTISIELPDDEIALEPDEVFTITLSLVEPNAQIMIPRPFANVTIIDNDVVTLGFDRADYQFTEGEAIELVVQKSAPLGTELPVLVVYDEMTVEGTFEAGVNATNNITISVTSRDDVIALEPDEVFIVTLTLVQTNPQILIPNPLANVTITDDDGPVMIGFDEVNITVSENVTDVLVSVTLAQEIAIPVTVDIVVANGTATDREDFVQTGLSTLTFNESGTQNILVNIVNDSVIENSEFFTIILSNPQPDDVMLDPDTISITIVDNDEPVITFEVTDYVTSEMDGSVDVCVTVLNGVLVSSLTVNIDLLPSTAIEGEDFEFSSQPPVINILSGMSRGCLTITILPSDLVEGDEYIHLAINEETTMAIVEQGNTTVMIASDGVVILRFDRANYQFIEGETIEIVIQKSAPLDTELTFIVSHDELTVEGTFEPGVNAANNVTISIESPDDEIALEPDEVFTVMLALIEPNAQIMIPRPFANVTITDNDVVTLGFDRADYQFTEGEAIEIVVQKSAPLGTELPVLVVYDKMTAEGTFEAGVNATNNITILIMSRDDVIALEPDEVFIVTLTLVQTNPQILIPNPLANVTVIDDDGPVFIGFDEVDITVIENISIVLVPVSLVQEIAVPVTVDYTVVDGTAIEGEDYVRTGLSALTFNESGTQNILVNIVNDSVIEDSEFFTIVLSHTQPHDLVLDANMTTITITDDDLPVITFEETEYITSEMDGSVDICVAVLNGILVNNLTVNIDLLPSTAVEGEDFEFSSQPPVINILSGMSRGCLTITILPSDLVEGDEYIHLAINEETTMATVEEGNTSVMIASDGVEITFEETVYSTSEIADIVAVCVTATSGILSFNLPVNIDLLPSTAIEGEDFTFISVPPVIVITSGTSRGCLIINIIPSDLVEGEEDIHLTINEETTQAVVLNGSTTVVIESDGVVMLRFDRAEYQFVEGEPIELVIQNIGQFYSNITFLVYGEGLINATATIEAGTPDTNITISALGFDDDSIALEPDEVYTVTLSLIQPNPQIVIPTPLASVTIIDNDGPVRIGFDEQNMTVPENIGGILVAVSLAQEIAVPVTVNFTVVNGTAMEGEDYVRTGLSALTFNESGTQTILVNIVNDSVIEDSESFTIILSNPQPDNVVLDPDTISITIMDDDEPVITFEETDYVTSEMDGSVDVCVTVLNGILVNSLTVNIDLLPSTALEGEDFEFSSQPPVINILSGMSRGCLTITILPSDLVEGDEVIHLAINEETTMATVEEGNTTVIIASDGVVILRFDQAEYRFIEGETIELVVTKSAPLDSELTFIVSRDELTVDGTFEAGVNAANNVTISIESPDDEIALEPDEVFTITLSLLEPNAQIMIPRPFANVTIIDNDVVTLGFDRADYQFTEGEAIELVVQKSAPLGTELPVLVVYDEMTVEGTFEAGVNASNNITISITSRDDVIALEPDEVFIVTLTLVQTNPRVLIPNPLANVTITDDDGPVFIGFDEVDITVSENISTVLVPVSLVQEIAVPVTVDYTVVDGTAIEGEDYVRTGLSALTFNESGTQNIFVNIVNDSVIEDSEFFTIVLSHTQPHDLVLDANMTTITITDDDLPVITFEETEYITSEMDGSVDICVTVLNGILVNNLTVNIDLLPSTAVEGEDFEFGSQPPVINILSGMSRGCLTITILPSDLVEGDEYIHLAINEETTMAIVEEGNTTVMIASDGGIVIGFVNVSHDVEERDSDFAFNMTLFKSLESEQTYSIRLMGITDTAGDDDFSVPEEVFLFPPESETLTVFVNITGDTQIELTEQFLVRILQFGGPPFELDLDTVSTVINIVDNDGVYVYIPDENPYFVEEGTTTTITFRSSPPLPEDGFGFEFSIILATENGTAIAGSDYIEASEVFFEAEIISINVTVLEDGLVELPELFFVIGHLGSFLVDVEDIPVSGDDANITIVSAPARIRFEEIVYPTSELDDSVNVCVAVTNGIMDYDLPVNIEVLPMSTAVEGEDYSFDSVPPVISILSGTSRGCLTINITASALAEDIEGIYLVINETTTMADIEEESTIVVIDADGVVTLGFSSDEYQFMEGDAVEVVVEYVGPLDRDITYRVFSVGLIDEMTTIEAGTISTNITHAIPGFDEDVIALEPDEVFEVELSLVETDPQVDITVPVTTVTITDNDGPVTIGFNVMNMTVDEDAGTINVPVTLAQEIAVPVTVDSALVNGTAMEGEDYMRIGLSALTFNGSGTQNILVAIVDNNIIEDSESFTVILTNPQPDNVVFDPDTIMITIIDDDEPLIGFEETDYVTSEMDGSVDVCVTVLNGILVNSLTVNIDLLPSTAIEGEDFEFSSQPPVINILSGMNRGCLTITILPSDLVEGDEDIHLAINEETTMATVEEGNTTVMIASDGVVILRFDRANYQFIEGETIELVVTKSAPLDSELTFIVSHDELSVEGTFGTGDNATNNVTISIDSPDDEIALEPDEVFTVELSLLEPNSQIMIPKPFANVTIIDDDGPVFIGFDEVDISVSENDTNVLVSVTLEQEIAIPVTVDIAVVNGTATEGEDYFRIRLSVLIFNESGSLAVPIGIVDDAVTEDNESFALVLHNPRPDTVILDPDTTTITIIDDDERILIGFSQRSQTVSEADAPPGLELFTLLINVHASRAVDRDYIFTLRVLENISTATIEGLNFPFGPFVDAVFGIRSESGDRVIEQSHMVLTGDVEPFGGSIFAQIRNELRTEDQECFTIQIFSSETSNNFSCNEDAVNATDFFCLHTICIEDDDVPFVVAFVETMYTVIESEGQVEVCVNLTQPETDILEETVRVDIYSDDNSVYIPNNSVLATPDSPNPIFGTYPMAPLTDYEEQTRFINRISTNTITAVSRVICYNQSIYDDAQLEPPEYIGLQLTVRDATILTHVLPMYSNAAILILDSDDMAVVGLERTSYQVSEDVEQLELCVTVQSPNTECPVAFPFNISFVTFDATAVSPMDYLALAEVLIFDACETQQCVVVTIVDDVVDEPEEVFRVALERTIDLDSRIILEPIDGEIIIADNDAIIGFTQRSQTVSEADGPPGLDLFTPISIHASRAVDRDYIFVLRILEDISTAIVEGVNIPLSPFTDALFGIRSEIGDRAIEETHVIPTGDVEPLGGLIFAQIRNEFRIEDQECFTMRIFPEETSNNFSCNEDAVNATDFFCLHTICIEDDDAPFVVAFVETMYTVIESEGQVDVCVNLTQPEIDILEETIHVDVFRADNSVYIPNNSVLATPDSPDPLFGTYPMAPLTDYEEQTSFINRISATQITAVSRIVCYSQFIYDDAQVEPPEYIGLQLSIRDATVLTQVQPMYSNAAILILDDTDDVAIVGLERIFYQVREGTEEIELCVSILSPSTECPIAFPFNVSISTSNNTAVSPMDYETLVEVLMFEACETQRCVAVTIVDDSVDESQENFLVSLERTPGLDSRITLEPMEGEIVIDDNEAAIIGFSQRRQTVSEAGSPQSGDLFPIIIPVNAVRPAEMDTDLLFRVVDTLSNATVDAVDNQVDFLFDALFGVRFEDEFLEEQRALLIGTSELSPPLTAFIRKDFRLEEQECFTIEILPLEVTFGSGENGEFQTFSCNEDGVNAVDNFCFHTICIEDDDEPFIVRFVETMYTVIESEGQVEVCVNLTQPEIDILDETLRVDVFTNDNSVYIPPNSLLATPDNPTFTGEYLMRPLTDYERQIRGINRIRNKVINATRRVVCYNQPIYNDARVERPEYIGLQLTVRDATVVAQVQPMYSNAAILIMDSDDLAVVGLERTSYQVLEGVNMLELCVIVYSPSIECPIEFPFNVSLFTSDNTAVSSMDYVTLAEILMFDVCETQRCVNVTIVDDSVDEPEEKFRVSLERTPDLDSRITLEPVDGEIVIVDDDETIVGFSQRRQTVSEADAPEGSGFFTIVIPVNARRPAETEINLSFRVVEALSTANVQAFTEFNSSFDALFGVREPDNGLLEVQRILEIGQSELSPPITTLIGNDFRIEEQECFTIQILPLVFIGDFASEGFICNEDEVNAVDNFCFHTICIEDDDAPFIVRFVETMYTVIESEGQVEVCVNLTQPETDILDESLRVDVFTNDNSVYIPPNSLLATPDNPTFTGEYLMRPLTDYERQIRGINRIRNKVINATRRVVCYNQPIYNDARVEPPEYIGLQLTVRDASVVAQVQPMYSNAAILIVDSDDLAVVGLERTSYQVLEGVNMLELCVIVYSPSIECPIEFPFNVSLFTSDNTAVSSMDYVTLAEIMMFDVCETQRCVNVTILNDSVDEPEETFRVTLERTPDLDNRITLEPVDGEIVIVDNDETIVGFSQRRQTVSEADAPEAAGFTITIPVNAVRPAETEINLLFHVVETLSTANVQAFTEFNSSFDALFGVRESVDGLLEVQRILEIGQSVLSPPITTFIGNDFRFEEQECFTIQILPLVIIGEFESEGFICNEDEVNAVDNFCFHTICIDDDDPPFIVRFVETMYTVIESEGQVEVCVNLTQPETDILEETLRVDVFTNDNSVYIPPNSLLATPDNPTFTGEYLMHPLTDYERQIQDINRIRNKVINATRRVVCYNQPIYNDARVEPPEYIGLQLTVRDATVVTQVQQMYSNAAILIVDSDDLAVVGLERTSYQVLEGVNMLELCVIVYSPSIECPIEIPFNVNLFTSDNTAVSSMDYVTLADTLMFDVCETQRCVNLTIEDDSVDESEETFRVSLERTPDLDSRIILDPVDGEIVIVDDDETIVGFSQRRQTVSEADAPVADDLFPIVIPVNAARPAEMDINLLLRVVESLGTAIVDAVQIQFNSSFDALFGFRETADDNLVEQRILETGASELTPPILALIRNDFHIEEQECFTIQILPLVIIGEFESEGFICNEDEVNAVDNFCFHTICIEDDDAPFIVRFVETMYTVIESEGQVEVCVNLTQPEIDILEETLRVDVFTNDNSVYIPPNSLLATPDNPTFTGEYLMHPLTDYERQIRGINRIRNKVINATRRVVCYNQPIYNDARVEPPEYIGLQLTVRDASVVARVQPMYSNAAILIVDSDEMAVVGLERTFYQVSEDVEELELCVTVFSPDVQCPIAFAFNISITTNDNTAVSPMDYVTLAEVLTFAACETQRCVAVTIMDDLVNDPEENFRVSLGRTLGLDSRITLGPVEGEIAIEDNDVPEVSLEFSSYVVAENVNVLEVCVQLTTPVGTVVDVIVMISSGSARAGDDYAFDGSSFVTLPAGTTEDCITIQIIDDTQFEGNETFEIELIPIIDIGIIISNAVVTIIDDDEAIACITTANVSGVIITCEGVSPQQSIQCSFSGGPLHSCSLPLVLTSDVSPAGNHSVRIIASPGVEDIVSYIISDTAEPTVTAHVPPLEVYMMNDSPRIISNRVEAEFEITRPVAGVRCFLRSQFDRIWQNCSSGQIAFSNLNTGLYVLKVQAFNRKLDANTVKRGFVINSDPNYCSLVLVNRGVTVSEDGSSAEVQFQLYGPATELSCVLDEGEAFTCANPLQLTGLGAGRHKLEVTPISCSGGSKSLSVKFTT